MRRQYKSQPSGSGKPVLSSGESIIEVVNRMGIGARFRLPGPVCGGLFSLCESLGPVQRVLMGILWMSSSILEKGQEAAFRGDILDLRHVSGFTSYRRDNEVISALEILRDEEVILADDTPIRIFKTLILSDDDGVPVVDWIFDEEFASLFVDQTVYSLLDIRQIVLLKKGLDLYMYRYARLIWNKRNPEITLSLGDMRIAAGMMADQPFKRLVPRLKNAVKRIAEVTGGEIVLDCFSERGRRKATRAKLYAFKPEKQD